MKKPKVGLAILPYTSYLQASLPLFQKELVQCLEWPFDIVLDYKTLPDWAVGLRDEYSSANRLIAHGVYYSLFDAKWTERQENWLNQLKTACEMSTFEHVTEHFGLMSSSNSHKGFPMPISYSSRLLQIGVDRIKRIQNVSGLEVGLENLALALSSDDVSEQGVFLEKLVSPVNGFIILDLHNLYCQSFNFDISIDKLVEKYPLHLVKEIHISGGSWSDESDEIVRRDTHDDKVPAEVFDTLSYVLPKCPHLEYVIFEQLNHALKSLEQQEAFQKDYQKIYAIVDNSAEKTRLENAVNKHILNAPLEDQELILTQTEMRSIFLNSNSMAEAKTLLNDLDSGRNWSDKMITTGLKLSKKWN